MHYACILVLTGLLQVGAAGEYDSFQQLGGKGRMVIPEGKKGALMITCTLDQQVKSWPYQDPEWQAASDHYMRHYLRDTLTVGLDVAAAGRVTVDLFATQPMVPLNSLTEEQSADFDAALVLILANHIGDIDVLREAIALAKRRMIDGQQQQQQQQ